MLALTEGGAGLALGMTAPFFNVLFAQQLHGSTAAIGVTFGVGSILTAFATLLGPLVVRRLGRVRAVAFLKFLGVPFLVLIALAPGVVTAGVVYVLAIMLLGGGGPPPARAPPPHPPPPLGGARGGAGGGAEGPLHAPPRGPPG